jgi:uncharacterized membrane protein HdeD (DUF308 family)
MKILLAVIGVILAIAGLISLIHPRFDYHRRDEIARVGSVRATYDRPERAVVPPLAGALLLVGGAVLIVLAARAKS